ncbi:hypothetical protein A9255_19725 [Xenorhabdus hominickii]|uniref:Uncharacterized protein n=1 Tax=Xenorhabdus hominickii TaxID=351679 RepID=A0ABN4S7V4_XENHO|nr:hypothetical protein A9255_19725 [Xenorhabdus hominickii]
MLSTAIITSLSTKFFFSQDVDRNYNTIVATYQKVAQLETQFKERNGDRNQVLDNYERLKKK